MEVEQDYLTSLPLSFFGTRRTKGCLLNLLTKEEQHQLLRLLNKTIRRIVDAETTHITCPPTEQNLALLAKGASEGRWTALSVLKFNPHSTDNPALRLGKHGMKALISILQHCPLEILELYGTKIGNIELNILLNEYEVQPRTKRNLHVVRVEYDNLVSKGGNSSAQKFFSTLHTFYPGIQEIVIRNKENSAIRGCTILPQALSLYEDLRCLVLDSFPLLADLPFLNFLTSLEELCILRSTLANALPYNLSKLVSLKTLSLINNTFPFTSHEFLHHPGPVCSHLEYLSSLVRIEKVIIQYYRIRSLNSVGFLDGCGSLKHLEIKACSLDDGLPEVFPFSNLTTLDLGYSKIDHVGESFASQLNQLVELSFRNCKWLMSLPETFFSEFSPLPCLKKFDLHGCLNLDNLPFNMLKKNVVMQLAEFDFYEIDQLVLEDFYEASKNYDYTDILVENNERREGSDDDTGNGTSLEIPPLLKLLNTLAEIFGEDTGDTDEATSDNDATPVVVESIGGGIAIQALNINDTDSHES